MLKLANSFSAHLIIVREIVRNNTDKLVPEELMVTPWMRRLYP